MTIEVNDSAPDFSLPASGDQTISLSDFAGKTVVLYFYPKDDTPGCTKESIAFTASADEFAAAGATILGISKDTAAKHDKFIAKHALGIALLSDAEGDVCERYGTWVEKNMYGKKYMGIERSTFIIDGTGTIRAAWRKVKVPGHVDAVLEAVKSL